MARLESLNIEISMAWWFKVYMYGTIAMCLLTGCEPNEEKAIYWCQKAIRAKLGGKRIKIS